MPRRAEECTRLAKTAVTAGAINDYLEMEQRWLALARSYEFAERLSNFTAVQEPQTAEGIGRLSWRPRFHARAAPAVPDRRRRLRD